MTSAMFPPDLDNQFQDELDTSETLLWTGQPLPNRYARLAWRELLMGIYGTAFAVFTLFFLLSLGMSALRHWRHEWPVLVVLLIFLVQLVRLLRAGISMLAAPASLKHEAMKTAYAVTARGVLLCHKSGPDDACSVRRLSPEQLQGRVCRHRPDGSGDLLFPAAGKMLVRENPLTRSWQALNLIARTNITVGFYGIPDVRAVDNLIRRTFLE